MAIVPVYSSSGRFDGGVSSTVTVVDAPGASEGIVAGDASVMYDVVGQSRPGASPLGAPPLLTTVNETRV